MMLYRWHRRLAHFFFCSVEHTSRRLQAASDKQRAEGSKSLLLLLIESSWLCVSFAIQQYRLRNKTVGIRDRLCPKPACSQQAGCSETQRNHTFCMTHMHARFRNTPPRFLEQIHGGYIQRHKRELPRSGVNRAVDPRVQQQHENQSSRLSFPGMTSKRRTIFCFLRKTSWMCVSCSCVLSSLGLLAGSALQAVG